jgi:hypothetical protein
MKSKDNYSTKRQLKAITSHGKHHSTTVSGNFLGIFPDGLDISPKVSKKRKPSKRSKERHLVENMTISIDLNAKELGHNEGFIRLLSENLGVVRVKKDFEVLSTTEKIIRAMAKSKFKNVAKIELDGKILYEHPEDFYDEDKAIEVLIKEIAKRKSPGTKILMQMLSSEHKDCVVEVNVTRVHMPWMHDILVKFEGILDEEYFRRVINYLESHLDIENIVNEWRNAWKDI